MSTTSLLTFEEFEKLPDAPGKRELLDGEVIEVLPPITRHSKIQHVTRDLLQPYAMARGLGAHSRG